MRIPAFALLLSMIPCLAQAGLIHDIEHDPTSPVDSVGSGAIIFDTLNGSSLADLASFSFQFADDEFGSWEFTENDIAQIAWQHDSSGALRLSLLTNEVLVSGANQGTFNFDKLALYLNWGGDSLLLENPDLTLRAECSTFGAAIGGVVDWNIVLVMGCEEGDVGEVTVGAGATGDFILLEQSSQVPAPLTWLLLMTGLGIWLILRRLASLFPAHATAAGR